MILAIPAWLQALINLRDYTLIDFAFFIVCFTCWVLAYWEIIVNIKKYKYVDMPIIAGTANIVWEFLWAFVFVINMGPAAVWGVRIWFAMDVAINIGLIRYASKQMIIPEFKKHSFIIYCFLIASWSALLYFFVTMKLDNGVGGVTAMLSNLVMSILYIIMVFRKPDLWRIRVKTAWYKFIGTGCISFISLHVASFRTNYFLITMGAIAFVLDAYYIYLLYYLRKFRGAKLHSLQVRNEVLKQSGFNPLSEKMPVTMS